MPITDANLHTSNAVFAYARVLDLWGKSGKFDVIVPYTRLSGTAQYQGDPVERDVTGFARPAFRLSINLYGAPALTLQEFAGWKQDLIVGASLQVSPPLGPVRRPGSSTSAPTAGRSSRRSAYRRRSGPWTLEMQAAATFFTDNDDFFGGHTRSQDPLYSLQGHVIYGFRSGIWVVGRRHVVRRRAHDDRRHAEQRPAAELARRRDAGASAWIGRTRSSSPPAAACRRAPATTSTRSAWRGNTVGEAGCDGAQTDGCGPCLTADEALAQPEGGQCTLRRRRTRGSRPCRRKSWPSSPRGSTRSPRSSGAATAGCRRSWCSTPRFGELFVIRVAGNVLGPAIAGTLQYAGRAPCARRCSSCWGTRVAAPSKPRSTRNSTARRTQPNRFVAGKHRSSAPQPRSDVVCRGAADRGRRSQCALDRRGGARYTGTEKPAWRRDERS